MEKYLPVLRSSKLFDGIADKEILTMLSCMNSYVRSYGKYEYIYKASERIYESSIVLEGKVCLISEDYMGNRNILSEITPGEMFGEVFACMDMKPMTVNAVSEEPSRVLFLSIRRMSNICGNAHGYHNRLIQNLLYILADKNLKLTERMKHTSKRTIRQKVLSYLSDRYHVTGSAYFDIPFNRQQLDDYLSVDRSALSAELCKMRDEGVLEFSRNRFHLLIK
jgi:CRP-like cAMP-binding protein